jgi:hypothetical protein
VPYKYNIICMLSFFFHWKNNVFGFNFHHLLTIFFPFQMCDSTSVCFVKCVLLQLLVLPSVISFFCCKIHFGKYLFPFFAQWLLF